MNDLLSIQAVHDLLSFSRSLRITDSRASIRILSNPHRIRAARLQDRLHISVVVFCLVQRDLIIILNVGCHGRHRVTRVGALSRLCELRAVGGVADGTHGGLSLPG